MESIVFEPFDYVERAICSGPRYAFPNIVRINDDGNFEDTGMINWDFITDFDRHGDKCPAVYPGRTRRIHVERGFNGKTGICVAHSFVINNETLYDVDYVASLDSDVFTNEHIIDMIRKFISNGFNIECVSFGKFQSKALMREVEDLGIQTMYVDVYLTHVPYATLKDEINNGKITMYEYSQLIEELEDMSVASTNTASALCGVIYSLVERL